MITPSQSFAILKTWLEEQKDIVKGVYTEYKNMNHSPFLLIEAPQINDIKTSNNMATSIKTIYRCYVQIGTQKLNVWDACGAVHDIGSVLRLRLLEDVAKCYESVFKDFYNITFLNMPVVGLDDAQNTDALLIVGRLGIEFTLEEQVELEGVLVEEIHNHYDSWDAETLLKEETYDESDVTSN